MSVGHRTQRVRVFTYDSNESNGRINPRYVYVAERWASASVMSADEATVATQAEHRTVTVFGFADEVTVTRNGLLKWDGRYWQVDGAEPRKNPSLREVQVTAFWVDDVSLTLVGEPT